MTITYLPRTHSQVNPNQKSTKISQKKNQNLLPSSTTTIHPRYQNCSLQLLPALSLLILSPSTSLLWNALTFSCAELDHHPSNQLHTTPHSPPRHHPTLPLCILLWLFHRYPMLDIRLCVDCARLDPDQGSKTANSPIWIYSPH